MQFSMSSPMTPWASDRRTRTRTRTMARSALKFFNSPERPGYYGLIRLTASVVRWAYRCVTTPATCPLPITVSTRYLPTLVAGNRGHRIRIILAGRRG